MINYQTRNITTINSGIIAHGVNCQGVAGAGVAKALRDKYPQIFHRYSTMCKQHIKTNTENQLLGLVDFVLIDNVFVPDKDMFNSLYIANIFTQRYFGSVNKRYADPDAIIIGLTTVCQRAEREDLPVYIPPIGCGLGGLSWVVDVEPRIIGMLSKFPTVNFTVCDI